MRPVEKVEATLDPCLSGKYVELKLRSCKGVIGSTGIVCLCFCIFLVFPMIIMSSRTRGKVSGGFRSDAGAEAHAVVSSVVDTARKRGEDVFETLQGHIGSPAPVGDNVR